MIREVASTVRETAICTDADLGGVRIAARIVDDLPATTRCQLLDVGGPNTIPGREFGATALVQLSRFAQRPDQVGDLARACHERGHRVEREAAVRARIRRHLLSLDPA